MSKFNGNAITWFEIPVSDIERAQKFYEAVLDEKLREWPGEKCFMFPNDEGGVGGCIVQREGAMPSLNGTSIFLNTDGKLDASVKRAEGLGAKVLVPRTEVPGGHGFFACIQDSEGNHVGLHSRQF